VKQKVLLNKVLHLLQYPDKKIVYQKKKEVIRVIISGGGTGGHVFPAIAIANAIRGKVPDSEILFIGPTESWRWKKCRLQAILFMDCG